MELFDFTGIENGEIKIRTNNAIERFHKKLNDEKFTSITLNVHS